MKQGNPLPSRLDIDSRLESQGQHRHPAPPVWTRQPDERLHNVPALAPKILSDAPKNRGLPRKRGERVRGKFARCWLPYVPRKKSTRLGHLAGSTRDGVCYIHVCLSARRSGSSAKNIPVGALVFLCAFRRLRCGSLIRCETCSRRTHAQRTPFQRQDQGVLCGNRGTRQTPCV